MLQASRINYHFQTAEQNSSLAVISRKPPARGSCYIHNLEDISTTTIIIKSAGKLMSWSMIGYGGDDDSNVSSAV